MRLFIRDGLVMTIDSDRRVISDGAVVVEGNRIVAVGKASDLEAEYSSHRVMDASGMIVMPGFVNAHGHFFATIMRGPKDDGRRLSRRTYDGRQAHGKYYWNAAEWHLDREDCYASTMLTAVEMIKSGMTCADDHMYLNFDKHAIDGVAQGVVDSGIRVMLGRSCWDMPGLTPDELIEDFDTAVAETERVISEWHGKGNGRVQVQGDAAQLSQSSDRIIVAMKELADRHGLSYTTSVCERLGARYYDLRRGDPSLARFGGRSIEYLQHLGVLGPTTKIVHCLHDITEREIDILAETQTSVAHCPVANAKGRARVVPVPRMLEKGVTVGLGTDSTLGNDMFLQMKACAFLHKVNDGDIRVMPAEKAIELATIDSAKSMQLDAELGSLETGKKADIILLSMDAPGFTPNLLPVKDFVYTAANGSMVDTVIIDGQIVMEGRVIKTFDETAVLRAGEDAARRVMRAAGHLERDPSYLTPPPWKYV